MDITKKPFLVSFAGNPMRYLLTSGNVVNNGTALSVVVISFTGIDTTEDHSIDISYLNKSRTMTLKNGCVSADDLPIADSRYDEAAWCKVFYDYILGDVEFTDNYDIAINDDGLSITLTAKVASTDYDWVASDNTINGLSITTTVSGNAGTEETVEGVKMSVWKNGTTKIGEDYKPLDASGTVKFDIQEYLYAYLLQALPPQFHLTPVNDFLVYGYEDFFIKYRTVFCDRVAGAFLPRSYSDPDHIICYALPGGLNREDLVANNSTLTDFFNLAATKKKFLTWAPPSHLTDMVETNRLFFAIQNPNNYNFYLMLIIVTEHESLTPVAVVTDLDDQAWTVVEFLVGYQALGLAERTHDNILKWQVYLQDENGTVISDCHEFVLDQKYAENTRYFIFRNSWGAYDSLRCTGVFEKIIEHEGEKVVFLSDETETSFNDPSAYTMRKELQTFKANTGWLSRDYLNYLRDFMLSSDIYEVEDGKLYKCLLTSKKTSLLTDSKYNYNLAFEYERAHDDFFFQISE